MVALVGEKNVVNVKVDDAAKAAIDALCKAHGQTQVAMMSRVYVWFSRQDDVIQKTVLGLLPKGMEPDIARLLLEKMARGGATTQPAGAEDELADSDLDAVEADESKPQRKKAGKQMPHPKAG